MNIDTSNLIKLEEYWVLVKKYNGSNYYYGSVDATTRRWAASDRWKNARNAYMYKTKAEAEEVCAKINADKKKLKLKVDSAANHFVSNFELYYEGWAGKLVTRNRIISIQDLKKQNITVNSSFNNDTVKTVMEQIKERKTRATNEIKNNPEHLTQRLNEMQNRYNQEQQNLIASFQNSLEQQRLEEKSCDDAIKFIYEKIKTGTLVEETKSKNDDKFKILYGKIEV